MAGTHSTAYLIGQASDLAALPPAARLIGVLTNLTPTIPAASGSSRYLINRIGVARLNVTGNGKIFGTTEIKALPNNVLVGRRVLLWRELDGHCFGETYSDPVTGYWEFVGVQPGVKYTAIVYDGPRVFRAACQDAITADPI